MYWSVQAAPELVRHRASGSGRLRSASCCSLSACFWAFFFLTSAVVSILRLAAYTCVSFRAVQIPGEGLITGHSPLPHGLQRNYPSAQSLINRTAQNLHVRSHMPRGQVFPFFPLTTNLYSEE